ncbi:unnamed protein product [Musa acuminata subsp. burmannicoides]
MTEGDIDAAQSKDKARSSILSGRVFRLRHANTSHVINRSLSDLSHPVLVLPPRRRAANSKQISSADVHRRLCRELRVMQSSDCPRMEARVVAETEGRNMRFFPFIRVVIELFFRCSSPLTNFSW